VCISFVRKVDDVQKIREILGEKVENIKIISKIENDEGIDNFDDIMQMSDGVIVMRKALSLYIDIEKLHLGQKKMIQRANIMAKTIIIGSAIFESMMDWDMPTRSEAGDIISLVVAGADCIMLTQETAEGQYPIKAIKELAVCCVEGERTIDFKR